MGPFTAVLVLLLSANSLAIPTGAPELRLSQRLATPALLVVDAPEGLISSRLVPGLPQPDEDPTNTLICKHLQADFTPYFVPHPFVPYIKQRLLMRSVLQDESIPASFLSDETDHVPWIVFSKKSDPLADPRGLRKVNLELSSGGMRFDLPAFFIVYKNSDLGIDDLVDYPEEVLAAPPPLFPSLCVSPEKPRPFPVLFAAPATQTYPSVASFSFGDLSPSVVTKKPIQPTFFKSYSYDVFCRRFGSC